jgi:hypothetical protein
MCVRARAREREQTDRDRDVAFAIGRGVCAYVHVRAHGGEIGLSQWSGNTAATRRRRHPRALASDYSTAAS